MCVGEECAVPPLANVGDDTADGGKPGIWCRAAWAFERGQRFRRVCRASSFGTNQLHSVPQRLKPLVFGPLLGTTENVPRPQTKKPKKNQNKKATTQPFSK